MLSLRDLLSAHARVLLIDSASARIQVGLLRSGHKAAWADVPDEAGTAIFGCTEQVQPRAAAG